MTKRRVFFITSRQMKVFLWQAKHLEYSYEFKLNDDGIKLFEEYLGSEDKIPSRVLVDLLEEDFQLEKIPHLRGNDKKALVDRQIKKHYRDNKYVHSHQVLREKVGRKDDEILLSTLSNTEVIDPWFNLFDRCEIPIIGIWSLPILSEKLSKAFPHKNENILLVTRQMRSILRETFFRNGKMLISRQIRIEKEFIYSNSVSSYLTKSVDQIHRFLANQRIIGFDSVLIVKSLMPKSLIPEARESFSDTATIKYEFIPLEEVFEYFSITSDETLQADSMFSFLCSKQTAISDHYSRREEKEIYYKHIADKSVFYFTYIGSLLLFVLSAFLYVSAVNVNFETQVTKSNYSRLVNEYNRNYSPYENEISQAALVKEYVGFANILTAESNLSPENLFPALSKVMSKSKHRRITLTSMGWEKYHSESLNQLIMDLNRITSEQNNEFEDIGMDESYTSYEGRFPLLELSGEMDRKGLDYRETVALMEAFFKDLNNLEMVELLWVKQVPVDVRVYSKFSDQSGVDESQRYKIDGADRFVVLMLIDSAVEVDLDGNYKIGPKDDELNSGIPKGVEGQTINQIVNNVTTLVGTEYE